MTHSLPDAANVASPADYPCALERARLLALRRYQATAIKTGD